MKKMLKLLLLLISFHLLIDAMNANSNVINLMSLQWNLSSLENKSRTNQVGLIGEFLINKKFKDILSPTQVTKNFIQMLSNANVLVVYDRDKSIYQLRTLNQSDEACEIHSLRNSLWMLNGLDGTWETFIESYLKILDPISFDKYFKSTHCLPTGIITFDRQVKDIKEGKITCMAQNDCLPQNSIQNVDRIFSFTLARHPANEIGKDWMARVTFAKNELKRIELKESIENTELYANAVTIFYPVFRDSDIIKLYDFIIKDDFCFGLDLGIEVEPLGHAICLIAHKVNNKIEYLLLDSYNNEPFDNYKYKYSSSHLIKSIKYLIEDPIHFKQTLIRRAYTNLKKHLEGKSGSFSWY